MNPDLQSALVKFVEQATTLLQAGTDQLPAVLADIVAYKLFDAWFVTIIGIVFLVIALAGLIICIFSDDYGDWNLSGSVAGFIGGIVGIIFFLSGVYQVYYVTHFPRLVILDYLKGLL